VGEAVRRALARRRLGSLQCQPIRPALDGAQWSLVASILAGNTSAGRVGEHGYVTALWVGTAACALSAGASWLLSRRREVPSPLAMAAGERERIALEEAELASAGLVGIEGERATRSSSRDV
jgi:hypothetical protein